jgi:hypothetical protein
MTMPLILIDSVVCQSSASAIGTIPPSQLPLGLVRKLGQAANGARGAQTFRNGRGSVRGRQAAFPAALDPEQTLKVDRLVGSLGGSVVERVG